MTAVRTAPPRQAADRATSDATVLRLLPERRRGWLITAVMITGLFAILGVAVAIQAQGIGDQEQYDALKNKIDTAQGRQRDLRVAVAEAESPSHVLDRARELGMIEPGASVAVAAGPTNPPTPPPAPTTTTIPKAKPSTKPTSTTGSGSASG